MTSGESSVSILSCDQVSMIEHEGSSDEELDEMNPSLVLVAVGSPFVATTKRAIDRSKLCGPTMMIVDEERCSQFQETEVG